MNGKILLRPLNYYRTIENTKARDVREGDGHICLRGQHRDVTFTATAGFNAYVICTSADAEESERRYRHDNFGQRLLKIHRASEFSRKVAALLGAIRYDIRDVTYSNVALTQTEYHQVDEWVPRYGINSMRYELLEYIAETQVDQLMQAIEPATVFTKPLSFSRERERRFMFIMPRDVRDSLSIESPDLASHVELVE